MPIRLFGDFKEDITSLMQACKQVYREIHDCLNLPKYYQAFTICIDPPDSSRNPAEYEQYLAQIHTLNAKKCTYIHHLVINDTLEIRRYEPSSGDPIRPIHNNTCLCAGCQQFPYFCDSRVVVERCGHWLIRCKTNFGPPSMNLSRIKDSLHQIDSINASSSVLHEGIGKDGIGLIVEALQPTEEEALIRRRIRQVAATLVSSSEYRWF
ncbi:MAG: hypothetical protein Q9180_000260 [Flavoplaca navasiana]